jgi:Protein of unknown function (DUF4019)
MKSISILALALALSAPLGAYGQSSEEYEAKALEAAKSWLATVDAGDYGKSWEDAATLFRRAVTKEAWVKAVSAARAPLGKVTSRQVRSSQYTTSLPGAPEGHYVVIQFDATFEKRKAVETVTPMLDEDGVWRVSGYYVR